MSAHRLPTQRAPAEAHWADSETVVVDLAGDIDACTAARVEETVCAHLRARPAALRVDLGEVAFLGTAGVRALMRADLPAEDAGVRLVIDPRGSRAAARAGAGRRVSR